MSLIDYLSDLYAQMTIELGACPQKMMLVKLQEGAREFCSQTETWKEWLDPHNLVDGKLEYQLDWEWCAEVRRIMAVRIKTEEDVTNGTDGQTIPYENYEFDQPDVLTLDDSLEPEEDVSKGLCVQVIYVPHLWTCDLPSWFINRYVDAFIAFAMKELMSMPKKSWTNPSRAAHYMHVWNDYVNKGKIEIKRANKNDYISLSA